MTFGISTSRSMSRSRMVCTLPGPTPRCRFSAGVCSFYHGAAACCDNGINGSHELICQVKRRNSSMVWMASAGAPSFTRMSLKQSTTYLLTFFVFGCGAMMMAFLPLMANMELHMGVTTGFVTGVTAATIPFGLTNLHDTGLFVDLKDTNRLLALQAVPDVLGFPITFSYLVLVKHPCRTLPPALFARSSALS